MSQRNQDYINVLLNDFYNDRTRNQLTPSLREACDDFYNELEKVKALTESETNPKQLIMSLEEKANAMGCEYLNQGFYAGFKTAFSLLSQAVS